MKEHKAVILGAVGVGATGGVVLPFSRAHESESDVIGMMYMAEAGYPPWESVKVWERFSKVSGGTIPFLSTHPTHKKRQAVLKKWKEQGQKKYRRSPKYQGTQKSQW